MQLARQIQRSMEDFAAGDAASTLAIWDPSIRWTAAGQGPLAGRYSGPTSILGYLAELDRLSDHTFKVDILEVRPLFGETYVARFRAHAALGSIALDVPLSLILDTRNERVVSVVEVHHDEAGWEAFWAAAAKADTDAARAAVVGAAVGGAGAPAAAAIGGRSRRG